MKRQIVCYDMVKLKSVNQKSYCKYLEAILKVTKYGVNTSLWLNPSRNNQ